MSERFSDSVSEQLASRYSVNITEQSLNLAELNDQIQSGNGEHGASVVFTGNVRVSDEESGLIGMTLEHYPGMTENLLSQIIEKAIVRWNLISVAVSHRVGYLTAGEPIVFVGTSARHRSAAFDGAQYIMDYLKNQATFWKKEHYLTNDKNIEVWVSEKKSDRDALDRWQ
jgi:molybdopterin synthase catalytic subunit